MWKPYREIRNREPDFKVKYRFYTKDEGGRKNCPGQGYRSDLSYDGDDIKIDGIFMVHPEFLENEFDVLMNDEILVPETGFALMWILSDSMRKFHQERANIGVRCYFMEGPRRVAEAEIVEILGLHDY